MQSTPETEEEKIERLKIRNEKIEKKEREVKQKVERQSLCNTHNKNSYENGGAP